MKVFQICYEGDLTLELALAVRRLKGEPNFDNSWEVELEPKRTSAAVARYLGRCVGHSGHLIVSETNPLRNREYLLIRHSVTSGFDYTPLRRAIARIGYVLDLPTASTYIVQTNDKTKAHLLGDRLEELCPYDSLMVTGIAPDFTVRAGAVEYRPALEPVRRSLAARI